jgi:hypothetical protein
MAPAGAGAGTVVLKSAQPAPVCPWHGLLLCARLFGSSSLGAIAAPAARLLAPPVPSPPEPRPPPQPHRSWFWGVAGVRPLPKEGPGCARDPVHSAPQAPFSPPAPVHYTSKPSRPAPPNSRAARRRARGRPCGAPRRTPCRRRGRAGAGGARARARGRAAAIALGCPLEGARGARRRAPRAAVRVPCFSCEEASRPSISRREAAAAAKPLREKKHAPARGACVGWPRRAGAAGAALFPSPPAAAPAARARGAPCGARPRRARAAPRPLLRAARGAGPAPRAGRAAQRAGLYEQLPTPPRAAVYSLSPP